MKTRCKMTLTGIEISQGTVTKFDDAGEIAVDDKGRRITEAGKTYSLKFSPVYHNDDPKHENTKFWAYTPSGQFTLGTVNERVAGAYSNKVGQEFYIDIEPVV